MKQKNNLVIFALLIASALGSSFDVMSKEVVSEANQKNTVKATKSVNCSKKFTDFTIHNSKLYKKEEFALQLEEFIGQCASKDLEDKIIDKINAFYKKEGYLYSFVFQKIHFSGDTAHISVLEGHIREVVFDERFENPQVREYIKKLTEIKPYNIKKAAKYIALLKRVPGVVGKIQLTPIVIPFNEVNPKDPATVDLVMENYFYRVFGVLSLDNRYKDLRTGTSIQKETDDLYTRHRAPNFAKVSLNINNPFSLGGQVSTTLITSGSHEDNTVAIGYNQPINSYGTKIITSVSTRQIRQPLMQSMNNVDIGIMHPIYLSLKQSLDASFRVSQYRLKNQYNTQNSQKESYDVKKFIVGVDYKFEDILKGKHKYSVDYHQSIKTDQSKLKSSAHDQSFRKIVADGEITYPIYCKGCNVTLLASGQETKNDLFKTEVFSVDIYNGARGFDDGEMFGERGLSTAIEFSKYTEIEDHMLFRGIRFYTYFDRSQFWNKKDSLQKPKSSKIASYGIGTDIYLLDNINFNIEYSKPISKSVNTTLFKYDKKPSSRIYLGIKYEFGF